MADSLTFTKMDADRILRRAAEIEGAEDSRPLTIDELRSIAGEAGFGAQAVERALAEARQAAPAEVPHPPVQKWGLLIVHLSTTRIIPVQISSDQLMTAVRLFQPYREGSAPVNLGERQITWRDQTGLRFTVTSTMGATEITVYVSRFFFQIFLRRRTLTKWVKAAADRLEALVYLVSNQPLAGTRELIAPPPTSKSSSADA
jgi:hypothetical protein